MESADWHRLQHCPLDLVLDLQSLGASKALAEAQRAQGIFAVASIFLAAGLIALLRLDDKLSSCFLFIHGLLEQFLGQFGEVKCA